MSLRREAHTLANEGFGKEISEKQRLCKTQAYRKQHDTKDVRYSYQYLCLKRVVDPKVPGILRELSYWTQIALSTKNLRIDQTVFPLRFLLNRAYISAATRFKRCQDRGDRMWNENYFAGKVLW